MQTRQQPPPCVAAPAPALAPPPSPPLKDGMAHASMATEPSLNVPAGIINYDLCRPFRIARDTQSLLRDLDVSESEDAPEEAVVVVNYPAVVSDYFITFITYFFFLSIMLIFN